LHEHDDQHEFEQGGVVVVVALAGVVERFERGVADPFGRRVRSTIAR
jgi:hypothetical protein